MDKFRLFTILPPLIFVGLAALFFLGMQREDPDALPSALVGRQAPPLTVSALGSGPGFDAQTLRGPGLKLVNFWASWCAPCRVEHPNLEALADEGIPIYGINYKDKPGNALGFLEELGDPFAGLVADEKGRTALDWGVYGVPETYLVGPGGAILLRIAGPLTQRVIEGQLRPAMAAAGG